MRFSSVCHWQSYKERQSLARGAAGGDAAAMLLDDFAANGQAHSRSLVLAAVQALKEVEYPLSVFLLETDAVIRDGNLANRFPLTSASLPRVAQAVSLCCRVAQAVSLCYRCGSEGLK